MYGHISAQAILIFPGQIILSRISKERTGAVEDKGVTEGSQKRAPRETLAEPALIALAALRLASGTSEFSGTQLADPILPPGTQPGGWQADVPTFGDVARRSPGEDRPSQGKRKSPNIGSGTLGNEEISCVI